MTETENNKSETEVNDINTKEELKDFLRNVLDKTTDGSAAPIYAVTAINYVMNLPNIYDVLDQENKELARDIWLHIKQAGFQLKDPAILFETQD
ncbi:MAG: hypothetical protein ACOX2O_09825 [Bdellovibrionota bacterium]|jgi:DNA polymerase IIIc chi subunit